MKEWVEGLALNLFLLTDEKVDIDKSIGMIRGWLKIATFFHDPVRLIRSYQDPNAFRKRQLGRVVRAALRDDEVYKKHGEMIMRAIGYGVSLLSDDQIRDLVKYIKTGK